MIFSGSPNRDSVKSGKGALEECTKKTEIMNHEFPPWYLSNAG